MRVEKTVVSKDVGGGAAQDIKEVEQGLKQYMAEAR
ncbi:hypothetical protein PF010_g17715, partial [Phytophthora fragariae]